MNPDVFITIAFAGIAVMVALAFIALVVPQARREAGRVQHREAKRPQQNIATAPSAANATPTAKTKQGAAVH
jgi:hypothetical protein